MTGVPVTPTSRAMSPNPCSDQVAGGRPPVRWSRGAAAAVAGVDQAHLPQRRARCRVCIEGVQAVVLGGDKDHVVACARDGEVRNPQRLGIDRPIHRAREQLAECGGVHRLRGQRVLTRVGAIAPKVVVVGVNAG